MKPGLIPQQLLKIIPCLVRAKLLFRGRDKNPLGQLEPLAIVCELLFFNGIRPAIATLVGHRAIITRAVEADLQVRAAVARFRATGRTAVLVFRPAFPTMSCRNVHK